MTEGLIDINALGATIAATTTSGSAAIPVDCPTTVRVTNDGTTVAYVESGITAPTATTSDMAIMPGATEVFAINPAHKFVAAIMASGTANITFRFSVGGR